MLLRHKKNPKATQDNRAVVNSFACPPGAVGTVLTPHLWNVLKFPPWSVENEKYFLNQSNWFEGLYPNSREFNLNEI